VSSIPLAPPRKLVDVEIDGRPVRVPEDATILDACRAEGVDTPTLCYADNLTPVNACRVCVVEVENARVLVPACSRRVEPEMKVRTDTERVRRSRRLVIELLGSSVDTSLASADWQRWAEDYGARPERVTGHPPSRSPPASATRASPAITTSSTTPRGPRRSPSR
jgi:ferredoxin